VVSCPGCQDRVAAAASAAVACLTLYLTTHTQVPLAWVRCGHSPVYAHTHLCPSCCCCCCCWCCFLPLLAPYTHRSRRPWCDVDTRGHARQPPLPAGQLNTGLRLEPCRAVRQRSGV
jgi:hypothetical protein